MPLNETRPGKGSEAKVTMEMCKNDIKKGVFAKYISHFTF